MRGWKSVMEHVILPNERSQNGTSVDVFAHHWNCSMAPFLRDTFRHRLKASACDDEAASAVLPAVLPPPGDATGGGFGGGGGVPTLGLRVTGRARLAELDLASAFGFPWRLVPRSRGSNT